MPVRFACPHCKNLAVCGDDLRGKKIRCGGCKKVLLVPAAAPRPQDGNEKAPAQALPAKAKSKPLVSGKANASSAADKPPAAKKKNKKPILFLLLGGGAALILFLAVGATGYFLFKGPAEEPKSVAKAGEPKSKESDVAKSKPGEPKKEPLPEIKKKVAEKKEPLPEPKEPVPVKTEPEAKNDPAPKPKRVIPVFPPKVIPVPEEKPAIPMPPGSLAAEVEQRVKEATVAVQSASLDGKRGSGSGFFGADPGIVLTTMQALGMAQANSLPPANVEVVLNSGEANETRLPGKLLGVDADSGLAVVRVAGPNLPAPLPLETNPIQANQKVYLFGSGADATQGAKIRFKDATLANPAETPLRWTLKADLAPTTSGGPIVNEAGKLVGVVVAGQNPPSTQAIPLEGIHRLAQGRVTGLQPGEPYAQNGQTVLPIKIAALDPLNRISQMRVEVWTGMPGLARPASAQAPIAQPGDGPRQATPLTYLGSIGIGNLILPTLPAGQVYWLQPVLVGARGATLWGEASAVTMPASLLERKPVDLTANLVTSNQRTATLKSTMRGAWFDKKSMKADAEILEILGTADAQGTPVDLRIGALNVAFDNGGQTIALAKPAVDLLRSLNPHYVLDAANWFKQRGSRDPDSNVRFDVKTQVLDAQSQICNALEATTLQLPNRIVNPGDTWQATAPLWMRVNQKTVVVQMVLTCTYDGVRKTEARQEAMIRVAGKLTTGGDSTLKKYEGDVAGKFAFDLKGAYISSAQVKIAAEPAGVFQDPFTFEIDLDRQAGNPKNIVVAQAKLPNLDPGKIPAKNPVMVPPIKEAGKDAPKDPQKTKTLLQQQLALTMFDPMDATQLKKKHPMKVVPVQMQAGKNYVVTVNAGFEALLRLEGTLPNVALVQGGTGNMTQFNYRAMLTGVHRVIVASHNGKVGPFQITVTEAP